MKAMLRTMVMALLVITACDMIGNPVDMAERGRKYYYTMEDLQEAVPDCPVCSGNQISITMYGAKAGNCYCLDCGTSWIPDNVDHIRVVLGSIMEQYGKPEVRP